MPTSAASSSSSRSSIISAGAGQRRHRCDPAGGERPQFCRVNTAPASRLTGPVPIANEEYATVQDGAVVNGIGTVLVVLVILWLALHSPKIIFAVFVNLFIGLSITTAAGLMMVGSLNLLSIAFAVLFVGLGRRFRHPVQRSLSLRALQERRSCRRAGAGRASAPRCRFRSRRWRPPRGFSRSCRPTTRAFPNSARSRASACWLPLFPASPCCRRC